MKVTIPECSSDYAGYGRLATLAHDLERFESEDLYFTMEGQWFAANLASALGALLYRAQNQGNRIHFETISPRVRAILSKNGFLDTFGGSPMADEYQTTIPYRRFRTSQSLEFAEYIAEYLRGKEMPKMSDGLRKEFLQNIQEVFENSVAHSETQLGIFACGQYYPRKHLLLFTVADLGMGIKRNLSEKAAIELDGADAILWAVTGSNTTRIGPVPGGLGLKLLKDFLSENGGRIEIVSDCGYWIHDHGQQAVKSFAFPFPGTIVSIQLNTADTKTYKLASESCSGIVF